MAVRHVFVVVLIASVSSIISGRSYNLTGIRVDGNRFVNNENQEVKLMVRLKFVY